MLTTEIIKEIEEIKIIDSEDFDNLDRIEELTNQLRTNEDGYLACKSLILLMERHPQVEFGIPGEPIHTIEKFVGHYEDFLYESLERKPTMMTVWMLNRIINSKSGTDKKLLLTLMDKCSKHINADELAKDHAKEFMDFQKDE
jgi:hypothetical protein